MNIFQSFTESAQIKGVTKRIEGTSIITLLKRAQKGDCDSIYYLISQSMNVIAGSFYTFRFGCDTEDCAQEFLSNLLLHLFDLNNSKKGPFWKFNPSTFSDQSDDFILNKFRYYMQGYAQSVVNRIVKTRIRLSKNECLETIYNSNSENSFEHIPYDTLHPSQDYPITEIQDEFLTHLKKTKPILFKTLAILKQGYKRTDATRLLGMNTTSHNQGISARLNEVKQLYKKYRSHHEVVAV